MQFTYWTQEKDSFRVFFFLHISCREAVRLIHLESDLFRLLGHCSAERSVPDFRTVAVQCLQDLHFVEHNLCLHSAGHSLRLHSAGRNQHFRSAELEHNY